MTEVINIERRYDLGPQSPPFVMTSAYSTPSNEAVPGVARSASPDVQLIINKSYDASKWGQKIEKMERLQQGWNGYSAPPPSSAAVVTARGFLSHLLLQRYEPTRLAPSSVGGVGFTHKKNDRRVYVEFFNDGQVCALFSDNETPPRSLRINPGFDQFRKLIEEIRDYLDA